MPIVRRSVSQIGKGRVNRERLLASTEREIARQIASGILPNHRLVYGDVVEAPALALWVTVHQANPL